MGLEEKALSFPARIVPYIINRFHPDADGLLDLIFECPETDFRRRGDIEDDPTILQIIGYVVFKHKGKYLNYERGGKGGERRLQSQRSMGIGGHINDEDSHIPEQAFYLGIRREINEEIAVVCKVDTLSTRGVIYTDKRPVDQVHLGVIIVVDALHSDIEALDPAIIDLKWSSYDELIADYDKFEEWSKILIDNIGELS